MHAPEPVLLPDERLDEVNEQLRLIQKRQGLTFGTDAYLLAAFIRPQPRAKAIELGSGSGIISLLLCARNKIHTAAAVEIQPAFAELTERNAALNGYADRIRSVSGDIRTVTPAMLGGEADLVFANPPYLRTGTGRTSPCAEKETARHELHGGIAEFCAAAARLLRTKGRFACVFRPERLNDLFAALRANRLEPKRMVFVHADVYTPPSMVLTEAVKDAAPTLCVLPPLFLYRLREKPDSRHEMTPEAASVYQTCSFPDAGKHRYNQYKTKENPV